MPSFKKIISAFCAAAIAVSGAVVPAFATYETVYEANFGYDHFELNDIKNIRGYDLPYAHLSWASFPCQDLSLAGSLGGIHASRSGLVWEWLRVLDEIEHKPKNLLL